MFGPIRAVAVDDVLSHLLPIITGLSALGIPCVGYWFDREVSELKPAPPIGGHSSLRIIFTDLNLAELGGVPDTAALWSTVVSTLGKLVSKNSGPYVLVFWTRVGAKASAVKDMLFARADQLEGIPCPIEVLELPKTPFLVTEPSGDNFEDQLRDFYTTLHGTIERLKDEIERVVAADQQLSLVARWESRAAEAAASAINEVHRCARADEQNAAELSQSLMKTLAKIAISASGKAEAKESPARALDTGLVDIVIDQFGASVDGEEYSKVVRASIGDALNAEKEIDFARSEAMYAELNTFFHVDREVGATKSWERGVVIATRPLASAQPNLLGFKPFDWLTSEFLFPVELFEEPRRRDVAQHLQVARTSTRFVLVELGADCDHAQGNERTRRYLLGLEIPPELVYLARDEHSGNLRNGALELLGPWKLDANAKYLLVSCRRFWTWQQRTPPPSPPLYRLRAPLVNKLLHRYATWSSRPGVVEFR